LNDQSAASVAGNPPHRLLPMLVHSPGEVELVSDSVARRYFMIRAAESVRERRSASSLIERMYATRGYHATSLPAEESPNRKTFVVSENNAAIGTLTVGLDSAGGLLAESLFPDEVGAFRASGRRICEFTKLAMGREGRSPRLLAALFHVAYIYAHRVNNLHNLLIEVNPRHVAYYRTMLGFEVISAARHNIRVDAPAVLLSLDLSHAEEQIRLFGGKPELSATERSAYPHFFSAKDEAGIVGRLRRGGEDVAELVELAPARAAAAYVRGLAVLN
jgi:hypothetical protein